MTEALKCEPWRSKNCVGVGKENVEACSILMGIAKSNEAMEVVLELGRGWNTCIEVLHWLQVCFHKKRSTVFREAVICALARYWRNA